MEDKEIEKAKADLEEGKTDLKVARTEEEAARAAEKKAEQKIDEALEEIKEAEEHHHHETHFEIQIDRKTYRVELKHMTGLQLRALPSPPLGPDRDLFEVVPGGSDRKIENEEVVEIRNGLRFFSTPVHINPGIE